MSEGILDQARSLFFQEAAEMADQMEASLLTLEDDPANEETLNALFRAAHTIKGSAGLFGLDLVVKFTHVVESVLDRVRDGAMTLDSALVSLLFESSDHIRTLLAHCEQTDAAAPVPEAITVQSTRLADALTGSGATASIGDAPPHNGAPPTSQPSGEGAWHLSLRFGIDTFRDGFDPLAVLTYLATLGDVAAVRLLTEAIPTFADLDPESCHLGFEVRLITGASKQQIESAFDLIQDSCTVRLIPPEHRLSDFVELIESTGNGAARIGEILVECGAITPGELAQALSDQAAATPSGGEARPPLGKLLVENQVAPAVVVNSALSKQTKAREAKVDDNRFIRVRADKLDELINLVGELVIAGAGTAIQAQNLRDPGLIESTVATGRLIEEIRNGALSLRMVPIGETFIKFKRVTRDMATQLGKQIDLEIKGAETELDKSVIENIGDPLMHLVRNALDHGMEMPDERERAGKSPTGKIVLSACHDSGGILIRIEDDGRGIQRERVLAKAREKGLLAADVTPADNDILNLIFEPGFSTAEQVTNLSGRGVGMDVVRRNIENLRGTVRLSSEPGTGTTVDIRLPLTLAIIDGFLVRVGACAFVIPLAMVDECVEGASVGANAAQQTTSIIQLRQSPLPVIHLNHLFAIHGARSERQSVVVVRNGTERAGLMVDQLLGEFQTVIKPLGKMFRNIRGIAGSTILGSGEVGLILDIASLITVATEDFRTTAAMPSGSALKQERGALPAPDKTSRASAF